MCRYCGESETACFCDSGEPRNTTGGCACLGCLRPKFRHGARKPLPAPRPIKPRKCLFVFQVAAARGSGREGKNKYRTFSVRNPSRNVRAKGVRQFGGSRRLRHHPRTERAHVLKQRLRLGDRGAVVECDRFRALRANDGQRLRPAVGAIGTADRLGQRVV
jgi:hypothetical protein